MTKNKKLAIVTQIDNIRQQLGQPPSLYDLIIDTLSDTQLNYYLGLAEEELFYNNI